MKKKAIFTTALRLATVATLMTTLAGCDGQDAQGKVSEPVVTAAPISMEKSTEASNSGEETKESETETSNIVKETPQPENVTERQDGERFEETVMFEGMEETVKYEHVRNEVIGFELDYDYETLQRRSEWSRETFSSVYGDPENPFDYLEVTYQAEKETVAAEMMNDALSENFEVVKDAVLLDRAGSCTRIEAVRAKDGSTLLQTVYVIPAGEGSLVATAHFTLESAEGYGARFAKIMNTLSVIPRKETGRLTDDAVLAAVKKYCIERNPDLSSMVDSDDFTIYWEIESSSADAIVVMYRSYTSAQVRYYIDPVTGETYVTEFVPGITENEERTEESFNLRDYL